MHDIAYVFPIRATAARVFDAMTLPQGLDAWWTLESSGRPDRDERYRFYFGPAHDWSGRVERCDTGRGLDWLIDEADDDWRGTRVGFQLEPKGAETLVEFRHAGWRDPNVHFRQSTYCWAMYLRLLTRFVEHGEVVPYDGRLRA